MDPSEQMEALRTRIGDLEDRERIRDSIASYGPAVDAGDSAAAAALWAPDGRYDVGGVGVSAGLDEIKALFDGEVHQGIIARGAAHLLSPVWIDVNGDRATAAGYSCVFGWRDGAFNADRVSANRWELQRSEGGWVVTLRINRLLDGSAEARHLLRR